MDARGPEGMNQNPAIAQLVNQFMAKVGEVADQDDWKESDGWVGQMILWGAKETQTYVYEVKDGRMQLTDSTGPFVATMTMSEDTFLDLIYAALRGRGEPVFRDKYRARHITYQGDSWLVDTERFARVFKRMDNTRGSGG
ncbi:hypothetical protein LCGC14_0975980 [marine sediment metagenome]|uniref:SCP2 domain-containing protein n=1 Tax=marine sediment metagenome TaxID=412755 RepID=A0A0F9NA50_9ZZZZ